MLVLRIVLSERVEAGWRRSPRKTALTTARDSRQMRMSGAGHMAAGNQHLSVRPDGPEPVSL
jgi:hypothetical protein